MIDDDGLCGFGEPAPAPAAREPIGIVDGQSVADALMPYWALRNYPMTERLRLDRRSHG